MISIHDLSNTHLTSSIQIQIQSTFSIIISFCVIYIVKIITILFY